MDFLQVLADQRDGETMMECSLKLTELMDAIQNTGKGGELTLKLKLKPAQIDFKTGRLLQMEIVHDCKINKPESDPGKSLFFVTEDGDLTRQNPKQEQLFKQEISK